MNDRQFAAVEALRLKLRRRLVAGPYDCALKTLELLRDLIGKARNATAAQLMDMVRSVGTQLVDAQPYELSVGSMVRRVLYLIREAYDEHAAEARAEQVNMRLAGWAKVSELVRQKSLTTMLSAAGEEEDDSYSMQLPSLKPAIMEAVTLFYDELENLHDEIARWAHEFIHADAVVLTLGASHSVSTFLSAAARKGLHFHVIVMEGDPQPQRGHTLARELVECGITCTVVPDAALFAIMPRVSQVVISTRAVMANGGLLSSAGTHSVALAAHQFGVPVLCVTGLYKLCPLYPHDKDAFLELSSPAAVLSDEDDALRADGGKGSPVQVVNPLTDYIPPELVSLYVTNHGGHQPSYIYRLMAEYYSPEDTVL